MPQLVEKYGVLFILGLFQVPTRNLELVSNWSMIMNLNMNLMKNSTAHAPESFIIVWPRVGTNLLIYTSSYPCLCVFPFLWNYD